MFASRVLATTFGSCPNPPVQDPTNLGEATCQEKGFYTLGAAAELVPISSLRRRERFFAKDR
jgi:hypothetical protein